METRFLIHLFDASLRSLPLALVGFAIVRIARLRSAAQAHAVWTTVLFGMLLLFFGGAMLKPLPLRVLPAPQIAGRDIVVASPQELARMQAGGLAAPIHSAQHTVLARRSISLSQIVIWAYASIGLAMLGRLLAGIWLAGRLRKEGIALDGRFYESSKVTVPLTVGWFKPRIMLPSHWGDWSPEELEAILLHENSHVRRRDGVIALLAGLNHCVFWFHPMAWWIERELALLAEQACDEVCVDLLKNRKNYARLLMQLAGDAEASGGRLSRHAMAMARPSQVHRRIDAILDESRKGRQGITRLGWTAAFLCGVPMIYAAGTVTVDPRQTPQVVRQPPPAVPVAEPLLNAQGTQPTPRPAPVQPRLSPTPTAAAPVNGDEQILIPFTATDPQGHAVPGLRANNFRVWNMDEQGHLYTEEQVITSLWQGAGRSAVALVVNSPNDMTEAVNAFRGALDPQDDAFVMRANLPTGADPKELLDLVSNAIEAVKQRSNPAKAVVVITHGGNNVPWSKERDLSNLIRRAGNTLICFVDIEELAGAATSGTQAVDMSVFNALLGAYVPAAGTADVIAGLTQIATQLRNTYWLGLVPSPPPALPRTSPHAPPHVEVDMPGVSLRFSRLYFPR